MFQLMMMAAAAIVAAFVVLVFVRHQDISGDHAHDHADGPGEHGSRQQDESHEIAH